MIRKSVIYFLLTAFLFLQIPELLFATEQSNSFTLQLKKAREAYYNGQFEQAQKIVLTLLQNGKLNKNEQFEALIILAEVRHALNDEAGARKIIKRILKIKPDYQPTIKEEPPSFVALVFDERKQLLPPAPQKRFYQQKKFWVLSGAALLGTVGLLIVTGQKNHEENKILPEPPNWPEN